MSLRLLSPLCLATALSVLSPLAVAAPVNKCVINGSVSFQQGPCPTNEVRKTPTLEELNAAEKKKRAEAAARQAASPPAPPATGGTSGTVSSPARPAAPPAEPVAGPWRCDGRLYCSQMRSCAEATWFLKHCPGVKMDGNHDGVPCEQQWCRP